MKDINLYFIRHGETKWNQEDKLQGVQNSPLTENGISGAKQTGKHLRNIPFLKAYSSPLLRAVETRDYIVNELDTPAPTDVHAGFSEMDYGIWEGLRIPDLRKDADFNLYMHHADQFDSSVNKGESFLDVLNRYQQALDHIIASAPEDKGNILIVSHGTALRLMLCVLNGGDWRRHRDDDYFPRILNTSISMVNYRQNNENEKGHYTVNYYNDQSHMN